MHYHKTTILLFICFIFSPLHAQINFNSDSISKTVNDSLLTVPKNRLNSAELIFATNIGVWSFDRYIMNEKFARINWNTINDNFKTGFVWDNDMFVTNLFAHPYHGGLYFNAARSNGLNFWQSAPFAAGGSLMWEFFMENEYPAINDFLATSIGGICLGEMTYRLSDRIIDDRSVGFERFRREALLTILSPARGLNRIISGKAWEHRTTKGNSISTTTPITLYSAIGHRIIGDNLQSKNKQDISNMVFVDLGLYYGNPYDPDNEKPYDFFVIKIGGNLFSKQPIISRVNALGIIFSKDITLRKPNQLLTLGFFQHFNYYQSQAEVNNVSLSPYKLSEAASFGPGLLYKIKLRRPVTFSASTYLSAILLGGSQTDHYNVENRDYNMGSGFSFKTNFELEFKNKARLNLNSEDYRIYSWIGYDPNKPDIIHTSVQGDKGIANLSVTSLIFNYIIRKHVLFGIETSYYYRKSIYKYYPDIKHKVAENKFSVGYIF
jgi:hypothetical protein